VRYLKMQLQHFADAVSGLGTLAEFELRHPGLAAWVQKLTNEVVEVCDRAYGRFADILAQVVALEDGAPASRRDDLQKLLQKTYNHDWFKKVSKICARLHAVDDAFSERLRQIETAPAVSASDSQSLHGLIHLLDKGENAIEEDISRAAGEVARLIAVAGGTGNAAPARDKAQDVLNKLSANMKAARNVKERLLGSSQQGVIYIFEGEQEIKSSVDVVIITIRTDENKAVLSRVPDRTILPAKNRTYTVGVVKNSHGSRYTVAIVRTPEQGPVAAQDTTRDAIEDLDPTWIMVVGIAGAVPDNEFTLGDVVIASRLHDFTIGALGEDVPPQFANQGGPMMKEVQDLLALLPALESDLAIWSTDAGVQIARPTVDLSDSNFYGDDDWRNDTRLSLRTHFEAQPRKTPLFTTRAIASSGSLIKNTEIIKNWQQGARDLVAVEMELSGVYAAARRRRKEYPVIAIRGISDIVGFKRSHDWTAYACNTAASFCVSLLANLPSHFLSTKAG
jgi:nucleoside phosphorylase